MPFSLFYNYGMYLRGRPVSTEPVGLRLRAEAPLASIKAAKKVTANDYAYAA